MKEIVGGMSMDYMTLKEASEKWGVSSRQVNYYCVEGRIPGAVKMARSEEHTSELQSHS